MGTAQIVCPMCYQFVVLLNVPGPPGSALQFFLGRMNDVPLANDISRIASVLIVFFCVANLFNVYSRFVQAFGLDTFDFETFDFDYDPARDAQDDQVQNAEAVALIARERKRWSSSTQAGNEEEVTYIMPVQIEMGTVGVGL